MNTDSKQWPDLARLRVFGMPTAGARAALADRFLRLLPGPQLFALLRAAGVPADEAGRRAAARGGLADLPPGARPAFRLSSSI